MIRKFIHPVTSVALRMVMGGCVGITLEKPLQIPLVDLIPQEITVLEQRMQIKVRIRNPNNQPLVINGLRFSLDLNKIRLLDAVSNQTVKIPRLGEAVTTVSGSSSTLNLIRQALEVDPEKPMDYRITGTVFLEDAFGSRIPFKNEGRIDLPKLLAPGNKLVAPIAR
jgi:LEA14-like dessication related protein